MLKPLWIRVTCLLLFGLPAALGLAQDSTPDGHGLRIGMIGLDTSHAPAFTKLFNAGDSQGAIGQMRVVAAYPGGSPDLASSRDRVEGFTQQLSEMGVEIVESITDLLPKVDAILLESVDGRKHLEQVLPVFKAGKPVFIDKPLSGNLRDAIAIDLLAKKYGGKWFSSSSLRFSPDVIRYREDPQLQDQVRGAATWGPCEIEPSHTDFYWYGIHGVESLYTIMGGGCETVARTATPDVDLAVGVWADGRIGTFRGIRGGKADYGVVVFGEKQIEVGGKYGGYAPLVERIAEFFAGGPAAVSNEETIEIMTFMQAADASKAAGGQPVPLAEVYREALLAAQKKIAEIDP